MKATKAAFKQYLLSKQQKEKQAFEKQHLDDELVMDAIEGYQNDPRAWDRFEQLEKKYSSKRTRKYSIYALSSIALTVWLAFLFIGRNDENAGTPHKNPSKTQDKALQQPIKIFKKQDVVELQPIAQKDRITAAIVVEDFQQQRIENTQPEKFTEPMDQLPVNGIKVQTAGKKLERRMARELLIQNFKAIDYRYYRKANYNARQVTDAAEAPEEVSIPYNNLLSEAIEEFSKGNYKLSLLNFDQILSNYPTDANALFYSALSLYNLKKFSEAENRLDKLKANEFANFEEEANWYLLLAYKQQKKEAAFSSLRKIISEQHGFYADRALTMDF